MNLKEFATEAMKPTKRKLFLTSILTAVAVLGPILLVELQNMVLQLGFPFPIASIEHYDVRTLSGQSEPDYFTRFSTLSIFMFLLNGIFWYFVVGLIVMGCRRWKQ